MRFACLGSGSQGNGLVIEAGCTRVLLDCGFSIKETVLRLARLGLDPAALSGIVVTHEHSDHISGVARLAARYRLPVYLSHGSFAFLFNIDQAPDHYHILGTHTGFAIGDLSLDPFPVPHDAHEPLQFVFSDGRHRLGVLTDTGASTPHIEFMLSGCDALVLECNHDEEMLRNGPYPPALKQRVGGKLGHLSNREAATLLGKLDSSRLQHVIAAHLSEKNNTVSLARAALAGALNCEAGWIGVADQRQGFGWRTLS